MLKVCMHVCAWRARMCVGMCFCVADAELAAHDCCHHFEKREIESEHVLKSHP